MTLSRSLAPVALAAITTGAILASSPKDASALMALESEQLEGGGGGGSYSGTTTTYPNKIIYLHGRSMKGWPSNAKLVTGGATWQHVSLTYNGSDRLTASTPRTAVKNAIATNCRGTNQCVIVCYSAGCARMLLAFEDLRAAGTPADKVVWIQAIASAAGGSEVADKATRWWVKLLAKIFGGSAAIDNDLKVGTMRGTFGYIQNRAPVPMYHMAGSRDMCRKVAFFFKMCGNKYLPGRIGDGAVPTHSSGGFATGGVTYTSCGATGSKYTNRQCQQSALYYGDHRKMVEFGVKAASIRLAGTATLSVSDVGTQDGTEANETYDDTDDEVTSGTSQITSGFSGVTNDDPSVVSSNTCSSGSCSYYSTSSGGGYTSLY